jgi:DNA-binding transcriptional LysR family regulator
MMKFEGIAAFVAVAEAGSVSEAARRLGLPKSVVSERLVELERTLGAHLLQRTTRKVSLTVDGAAFLERGRRMMRDMVEATAEMAERRGSLVGPLRISAPVSFGLMHLGPALSAFLADNPGIVLTLDLDDRFADLAADGYDAAIRHGHIRDTRLVAKPLAPSRRVLVASPHYFARRGSPRSPEDLKEHGAILYSNRETDWRFKSASGWTVVRPQARLLVNNGLIMRDATLAGLGIALLPTFMIAAELSTGTLQVADIGAEAEGAELHIAYSRDRVASAKLRALTQYLRGKFGDPPYWDIAAAKAQKGKPSRSARA